MKNHSTTSIILGHKNLGELDKIVFLYNEELGKTKAIAKGARRITSKFVGHLESLNICKTQLYFGPRNIILTEIESTKTFKKIRDNLEKTNCALQIAEITDKLIYENQKVEGLKELFLETMEYIEKKESPQIGAIYYSIKLLDKTGLIPDFKETETTLTLKYRKFFNFIQNNNLQKTGKIKISPEERREVREIMSRIMKTSF